MPQRPTIAFRVDEEQKAKWQEFVEENDEYNSVSHLIRVAVSHEMSDRYGPNDGSSGGSGDSEQLGELVTAVEKMQQRLTDVEDAVDDATEAAYSNSHQPANIPNEGELLAVLPYGEENAITTDAVAADVGIEDSGGTMQVGLELERMAEETGAVEKTVDADDSTTARFYRED